MSHTQQVGEQVLAAQPHTNYEMSWLEIDDEVEVIWTDAEGKPHKAVGRYQGIAVPDQGGPSPFVLKAGDDEIHVHLDDIAGMTRLGLSL